MSLIDLTNVSLTVMGPEGVEEDGCVGGSCRVDAPATTVAAVVERETPRG